MSETAVAPAAPVAQAARRKGVRNRLIMLVATMMGLWLVSLAVAVVGLTSARSQNQELSEAFSESGAASSSYSAAGGGSVEGTMARTCEPVCGR